MRADQRARRDAFLKKLGTRPVVMGILNLTPDSFSDGGKFLGRDAALAHARDMAAQGCDIVDVGGESTRPGAAPVAEAEELKRVATVLAALSDALDVPLSIDTYKAAVASRAVELGAVVVNDIWGLQKDAAMADAVASAQAAVVITHNRDQKDAELDIIADIKNFFARSLALAAKAGIAAERIILDPGIGFGKTSHQNAQVLVRLGELKSLGHPILIGLSRKKFLGTSGDGSETSLYGTLAANLTAAINGAAIFRVHDVGAHVIALGVLDTIRRAVT